MGEPDAEDTETMTMIDFDDTAVVVLAAVVVLDALAEDTHPVVLDGAGNATSPPCRGRPTRMRTHAEWPPTPPAPARAPRRAGVYPTASPR
jgi:hypothetical protein